MKQKTDAKTKRQTAAQRRKLGSTKAKKQTDDFCDDEPDQDDKLPLPDLNDPEVIEELLEDAADAQVPIGNEIDSRKKRQGRKLVYNPDYHPKELVRLMSKGLSQKEVAREFGVWNISLQQWAKKYAEFSLALRMGTDACEAWWMTQGRVNLQNSKFNYIGWMMNMTNRFRENWKRNDVPDTADPDALEKGRREAKLIVHLYGNASKEEITDGIRQVHDVIDIGRKQHRELGSKLKKDEGD